LPCTAAETYTAHSTAILAAKFNKVYLTPCTAVTASGIAAASDKRCSLGHTRENSRMLSKDQASSIAEELLLQERQRSIEARNAAAKKIPRYYQIEEFKALQPYERAEILSLVQKQVNNEPFVMALIVALVAALSILLYFTSSAARPAHVLPLCFPIFAAVFALRATLVRSRLRRALRSRNADTSSGSGSVA
jgi:hypothetical protein